MHFTHINIAGREYRFSDVRRANDPNRTPAVIEYFRDGYGWRTVRNFDRIDAIARLAGAA